MSDDSDWLKSLDPEAVARWFHEGYEELAPSFGYETRKASAKPWEEVPENNRRLMVATVARVLVRLREGVTTQPLPPSELLTPEVELHQANVEEFREVRPGLTRERDEAVARAKRAEAECHRMDSALTRVKVAIDEAGIEAVEKSPPTDEDLSRWTGAGGQVVPPEERIRRLARLRDLERERAEKAVSEVERLVADLSIELRDVREELGDAVARAEKAEAERAELEEMVGDGGDGTLKGRIESLLSELHTLRAVLAEPSDETVNQLIDVKTRREIFAELRRRARVLWLSRASSHHSSRAAR